MAYSQVLPPFGGLGHPGLVPPFLPPIIPPPFFGPLFPPFLPFFRPFFGLRRFGLFPFLGKRDTTAQVQPEQAQKIEVSKADVEEMHKAIRAAEATLEEMKKAAIEAEKIATEKVAKSVEGAEGVKVEQEVKKVVARGLARGVENVEQQQQQTSKFVEVRGAEVVEPSKVVVEKSAQEGTIIPTSLEMQDQKKVAEKSVVEAEEKKIVQ